MKKQKDYLLPLLAFIALFAVVTSLPFPSEDSGIYKAVQIREAEALPLERVTLHVSRFNIEQQPDGSYKPTLHGRVLESDLSEDQLAELFYIKEEINIRTNWNGYTAIISGDNGEF